MTRYQKGPKTCSMYSATCIIRNIRHHCLTRSGHAVVLSRLDYCNSVLCIYGLQPANFVDADIHPGRTERYRPRCIQPGTFRWRHWRAVGLHWLCVPMCIRLFPYIAGCTDSSRHFCSSWNRQFVGTSALDEHEATGCSTLSDRFWRPFISGRSLMLGF